MTGNDWVEQQALAAEIDDDLIPVEIRVKSIADELEEVRAKLKALKEREAELVLEARATVPGDGTFGPLNVSTPQNLDTTALAAAYPATTHPYLYKLGIDPAKAKAHLEESTLSEYKTPGTPRVSVKR